MNEPRWLTEAEQRVWRSYLAASQLLNQQLERDLQREFQVPLGYYEILVRMSEAPGRSLRMSDLADVSESSRSRLSHAVTRLEARGWVRRESCETDRRGAFAVLTDEGFAALETMAPVHVDGVRRHLFDQLGEEQADQLGAICDAVLDGLRGECAQAGHELPTRLATGLDDQFPASHPDRAL